MSIRIMNQVWQRGPQQHYPCMVLVAIADNADDTGECYPSITLLQQKARMSKSAVLRALKWLSVDGWIEIRHRAVTADDGRARGNLYCISLERLGLSDSAETRRREIKPLPREAKKRAPRSVTQTPHETTSNETEANKRAPRSVPETLHEESRGVQQTPHENAVRCQGGLREVSGVKSPPAPPLVGNRHEPPDLSPQPPASGGHALDADARAAKIASLEARLKTVPKLSQEHFAIGSELMQLRREDPKPQACADGDRAAVITLPPAAATLEALTGWLMAECGVFQEDSQSRKRPPLSQALSRVIGAADPAARPERAAQMAAAWRAYKRSEGLWGLKKFFLEGHWQHPASWPRETRVFDPCAPPSRGIALA